MSSPPRWPRGYTGRLFRVERQAGAGAPSVTVSSCPAVSRPNSTGMKAPIAYSLTTGCGVLEALVRAAQRGVDVRLIADRTTPRERAGGVDALVRPGASVLIDRGRPSRTMVIDGRVTLFSSMNWSGDAARNSENLNLVASRRSPRPTPATGGAASPRRRPSSAGRSGTGSALLEIPCEWP